MSVLRLPEVRAKAHRGTCGGACVAQAAATGDEGRHKHLRARKIDEVEFGLGYAHVHDVCHLKGNRQLEHRLGEGKYRRECKVAPVAPKVAGH